MTDYWPRLLDRLVERQLHTFGAVLIEGPRSAGKTMTGVQHAASSIRLDASPELVELARLSPGRLLEGDTPRLIDEWQLAPTLWNALRHEVDRRATPGQFILAGSAVPTDTATHHSGAGRVARLMMRPMSLTESRESTEAVSLLGLLSGDSVGGVGGPSVDDYAHATVRGGWPVLVADTNRAPSDFLSGYLSDVARVDLAEAGLNVDPVRMVALLRAVSRNIATEVAGTKLGAEAEISAQSARKYLDALTRIFILEEQPAWAVHLRSKVRLRVQSKLHFIDPSIAATALGVNADRLLADLKTFGFLFESLCIRDLRIYAAMHGGSVFHYRDTSGLEVDAIVELPTGSWGAFEVKLGGEENVAQAASNLLKMKDKISTSRQQDLGALVVLTAGETSYTRDDGVHVVPLGHLTT